MFLFLSILLSIGIFFFLTAIHNGLLIKTKKRRAFYELFSGLFLSILSLFLIVLL